MSQIIEYIVQHYIWIIICIVLILLAIIGYYADKTNFGQGKKEKNKKNDLLEDGFQKDEIGNDIKETNEKWYDYAYIQK